MNLPGNIFKSEFDFNTTALEIFRLQSRENIVYKNYLAHLKIDPLSVSRVEQIPFLPIRFFKSQQVITGNKNPEATVFTSSGTTGSITSSHYVNEVSVYEQSFLKAFEKFYGNIEEYCLIALLPSYLERGASSLVYMCDKLIAKSNNPQSGFYLNEYKKLSEVLKTLEEKKQKTILIGVTYALLDFAELFPIPLQHTIIMETGGMKGKRKEMLKSEMQEVLKNAFSLDVIHSEYGMTELLSQAYSKGNEIYNCPSWMKVFIRDTNDPLSVHSSQNSGGLNIIDLANIHSCAFIATQDLGRVHGDGSFEVLGRFDDAEIRGCNLMVE